MYRNYKVVAFTPSGRKRTQSILLDHLEANRDIVDEYQVWVNTDKKQTEDTKWLKSLGKRYDWVKVIELPDEERKYEPKQMNTGLFYTNTIDPKTIYVRFDDDIVYIDDDFFKNLLDFRIDNPDYFIVMANIWNNAILSYIHQQLGNIPDDEFVVEDAYCMDPVGWRDPDFAKMIHRLLLKHINDGTTDKLFFEKSDLTDIYRFSISCFCFFGKDFAKFEGLVGRDKDNNVEYDEEVWLTEVYPTSNNKLNTICGSALVSHYSFFAQRPSLDRTDILEQYKKIAKNKLSDNYYKLLRKSNDEEGQHTPKKQTTTKRNNSRKKD